MLTPEYLGSCTDYLLALYDGLEEQILQDMARRIVKTGELTETTDWQYKQLQEMGALQDFIYERLAEISGKSDAEIRRLFAESAYQNITTNAAPLISHGIAVEMDLSAPMRQILEANVLRTSGNIKNLTRTIGSTGSMTYYDISNQAFMQAMSGAFSPEYAIREAIRRLGGSGVTVMFPGRKDKLDVAVRRNVRTSVGQTAAAITIMQSQMMGVEYYETTAHIGARPEHAVWQGRVFKIEGSDPDHENFYDATQYGTAGGLCGINCRHQFFPFWPGISKPAYSKETLDHYNNATVTYNGEEIPYYVATQMQRAMERGIRDTKRSVIAADAAREEATDEAIKGALDEEFNYQSSILKKREKGLKDFLGQTGLSADGSRTNVVGFGRSVSQKAVWAGRSIKPSKYPLNEGVFSSNVNPRQGKQIDVMRPHNIMKDLRTSEAGKSALQFLEENEIPVDIRYNVDNPDRRMGVYDPIFNEIIIYADEHESIHELSKTVIHEAYHARYNTGTLKEEVACRIEEAKHDNQKLTLRGIIDIIKAVRNHEDYVGLPWR